MCEEFLDESLPIFETAKGKEEAWSKHQASVPDLGKHRRVEKLLEDAVRFALRVQRRCSSGYSTRLAIVSALGEINKDRKNKGLAELGLGVLKLAFGGYWRFSGALNDLIENESL